MKQKIRIIGLQVHDVGYRYFLMSNALDPGLKGFSARNRIENGKQEVIALIDGDEELIEDFRKLVETKKPEHARISNAAFEDYRAKLCVPVNMHRSVQQCN